LVGAAPVSMCRRGGGTTFKPGGGAGALREEAAARQLRGVGEATAEAEAAAAVAVVEAAALQWGTVLRRHLLKAPWRRGRAEAAALGRRCC
jgi:hypothetical protein